LTRHLWSTVYLDAATDAAKNVSPATPAGGVRKRRRHNTENVARPRKKEKN
jgi:hypothetical protein